MKAGWRVSVWRLGSFGRGGRGCVGWGCVARSSGGAVISHVVVAILVQKPSGRRICSFNECI